MKVKVAYFEITNRCNLNCTKCYNRSGLNQKSMELSKEQLKRGIDAFIPLGLHRVLLSGGEPTLHSEFDDILDLTDEYPQISFGIVTNGTVHNAKLINILNTKENFTIQISLDGSDEEQNAKTRGTGNFAKAVELAEKLRNAKTKPLLKMVVSQHNIDDVERFYRLAVSIGCVPEFAFVNKMGSGYDNWESVRVSAKQKMSVLKTVDRLNRELNVDALLPLCTGKCPFIDGIEEMSVAVKCDGSVMPCQLLYDDHFKLGNILELDVEAFERRAIEISDMAKTREQTDYGCVKCILRDNCKKGCMAYAFFDSNDPLANDGGCEYRKLQFVGYDMRDISRMAKL